MPGSPSSLPNPQPPASKAGGLSWAKKAPATAPAKLTVPVVEIKKLTKLMQGLGKSIAAIEMLPDGGFRILAKGQVSPTTQAQPQNPWDDWIANDQS